MCGGLIAATHSKEAEEDDDDALITASGTCIGTYDLVTVLKITHHHPYLDGFLLVASHNNGDDGNDLSSAASRVYVLCACLPTYLTHHLPRNCTSPRPTGTIYDSDAAAGCATLMGMHFLKRSTGYLAD